MKAKVAKRALEARMRRHLADAGLTLRKCRADSKWHDDLGDYYTVESARDTIRNKRIDLEALARTEGVLKSFEVLADE